MTGFIRAAIAQNRAVMLSLFTLLAVGAVVYGNLPKEFEPDIEIPFIFVRLIHPGISPEDASRLLIRPVEQEIRSIEGIREITAFAHQDGASLTIEFEAGRGTEQAVTDVRQRVDLAKGKLPAGTEEPVVSETSMAQQQPILILNVTGDLPERELTRLARELRDRLEDVPGVLEVRLAGAREEVLEVVIDPVRVEAYGLSQSEVLLLFQRNNQLVAAGALQTAQGRFPVKVPGVFESAADVLGLPIKVSGQNVVTLRDIASVRRTYKDAESAARLNGARAISLEVVQRGGANIIRTAAAARDVIADETARWPAGASVLTSQDRAVVIEDQFRELQNHVLVAVLLVVIVLIGALGLRNAALTAVSIPGSFLVGMLVLGMAGLTMNTVTMFALIMSVGLVVDGAIIVVEYADRKMAEGLPPAEAYAAAGERMFWPVVCATGTTIAAFGPLMFWPGQMGEMMKYMPYTLISVLCASILLALVYVPVMGSLIGRPGRDDPAARRNLALAEAGNLDELGGALGWYYRLLARALRRPGLVAMAVTGTLALIFVAYGRFNHGTELMPAIDPDTLTVDVRARGDLSLAEKDALLAQVEARLWGIPGVRYVYAKTGATGAGNVQNETDRIGVVQLLLHRFHSRDRSVAEIHAEIRERVTGVAGVIAEVREPGGGMRTRKPIQIEVSARDQALLAPSVATLVAALEAIPGAINVEDNRPLPGIEWRLEVDRAQAARFGADVALVGSAIQLVTTGVKVGEYRPDDADDAIDIRVRFPYSARTIDQLDNLRILTPQGAVPISSFVTRVASPKVTTINRSDLRPAMRIEADVAQGYQDNAVMNALADQLPELGLDPGVSIQFKGIAQDRNEAGAYLTVAFLVAVALIAIILVMEFNSISQTLLILTAVVFSTGGALLGYLVTGQPFGLVMGGMGVITLAGIVVNNNIVLIDTYNILRRNGLEPYEAILRTCVQRVRPVLLTNITIILGLMPLVLGLNLDVIGREITVGGQSAQWWQRLSTAVVSGAAFATVLTLLFTPALLLLQARVGGRLRLFRRPGREEFAPRGAPTTTG